jgi:succinate-semialdehyde dehydrogenase/glutarate-semialdehyde dehydrogenase
MTQSSKADGWLKEANCIAGEWVGADDGKTCAVDNPAADSRIGDIP